MIFKIPPILLYSNCINLITSHQHFYDDNATTHFNIKYGISNTQNSRNLAYTLIHPET
jgi:hypothetical protein